jgi:hypothetical protein
MMLDEVAERWSSAEGRNLVRRCGGSTHDRGFKIPSLIDSRIERAVGSGGG